MLKKSISVMLAVVIMMGVISAFPSIAFAKEIEIADEGKNIELVETGATKTQAEAVAWIKARGDEGWWKDVDGVYGCQCVDFIQAYYQFFGYSRMSGYAWQYQWDHIPSGSNWYYSDTPIPGSVFVQSKAAAGNDTGHVGIVYALDATFLYTVETNIGGNGNGYDRAEARYNKRYRSGVTTYINPDFGPNFTTVDIGTDFYAIILNSHYWKPIENNNHNVVLGTENHTRKQLWKFERQNDLSYKIISLFDNEVIDLNNYGTANGTNIGMCASTDSSAQRWYITNNNGAYCFIPKCSPNGAMDINNNDSTDGTNIHYWAYHGKDSQTFSIYRIDDIAQYLSVDIGSNFTALILNSHYWKPIENRDHNVVLSTEDYSKKQLWRFERQSDKSYKIISLLDNEVIDLNDFGNANGTNIGMCVSTDSSAQRWYITNNNGAYCLIPKCSQDGAMDINNNDSADGTNIHYWSFHGKDSQTFSIYTIIDVNEYLNSHTDPTSVPTETTEFLGDVDGDGEVTIIDATCIQRKLANIATAKFIEAAADTDEDGELTIIDATVIQRWLAQLPSNENVGKPIT